MRGPPSAQQEVSPHHTLTVDFLASSTVRNKCRLFKMPRLWEFVTAAELTKTVALWGTTNLAIQRSGIKAQTGTGAEVRECKKRGR